MSIFRGTNYGLWYLFCFFSLVGGVAAASYSGALYLIVGFLIGLAISQVIKLLWRYYRSLEETRHRLGFLIVWVFGIVGLVGLVLDPLRVFFYGPCASMSISCMVLPPPIDEHHVEIVPMNLGGDQFKVQERLVYRVSRDGPVPIHLPPRIVYGEPNGFFLHKLTVAGPAQRKIHILRADGLLDETDICGYNCAPVSVLLYDFPPTAFYAAEAAEQPLIPAYPGLAKISWTIPSFYSGRPQNVVFWYHPTASPVLLLLLRPFAGVASFGKFALAAIGFAVSALMTYLLLPIVQDIIKKWIKVRLTWILRRWRKKPRS